MEKWIINKTKFEADEINQELAVSPWSGHRQFVYDLVEFVRPQRIVELGTHYGCSFFAFLQSCKDFNLSTEVIAIDSWEGDKQAGFYGEEVINVVKETVKQKFPKQNIRLVRKYFCDAVSDIEDGTVDILHIDGLHTYEAVSQDFAMWLPKLKNNGIVLFHDVASKLKYGTNDFWEEIKVRYTNYYTFEHSWGLGVLFPKGNKVYEKLEENNMQDKLLIYEYYAENLLLNIQLTDHQKMVRERDASIKSMAKMIDERDASIKSMTKMIDERDVSIKSMTEMVNERDASIKSMTEMVNERDASIKSMTEMINERDASIKSMTEMIDERDASMKSMTAMIDDRDACIKSMTEMIDERDQYIVELTKDREM